MSGADRLIPEKRAHPGSPAALPQTGSQAGAGMSSDHSAVIQALIQDAIKDTALWLQADPSAEERAYVLAVQGRIATLYRIILRRMERRALPGDEREWRESMTEVLSQLEKAREARGSTVGTGLARLADSLPRELPALRRRRVTQLPPPPRVLTGGGWIPPGPKPTQIPADFPAYFPNQLKPETAVIFAEAVRKFPHQTQTLELCKHVISEMTPLFRKAVKTGTMRADLVLADSGIAGLLDSLLVYNCHNSDERFRLEGEARKSDEWLRLARAIAKAQARSSLVESNEKATRRNAAPGGAREAFLRSILDNKGFSVHDWANKAGVDFHTADNFLKGKTQPYQSTRKKLAKALDVEAQKIPE